MILYSLPIRTEWEEGLPFIVPAISNFLPPEWLADAIFPGLLDNSEPFLWNEEN